MRPPGRGGDAAPVAALEGHDGGNVSDRDGDADDEGDDDSDRATDDEDGKDDDDRESGAASDTDSSPPAAQLPERLSLATIGSELDHGIDAMDDDDDEEEEEDDGESSEGLSI